MDLTEYIESNKNVGSLKKGNINLFESEAWKVLNYIVAKTGKHGADKWVSDIQNIFSLAKKKISLSTASSIPIPIVKRIENLVLSVDENDSIKELTILD